MPRVSIGLPVYNGETYLAETIDSVLAQTFEDFELIICDNASTDRTERICREYAERDARIRYFRNQRNLGAAKNFNRSFELSTGEYFKWIAADSAIEPGFLARCVEILDQNPTVILACTNYIGRSEITNTTHVIDVDLSLRFGRAHQRFREFIDRLVSRNAILSIWGLMRSSVLKETHLIRPLIGADHCLVVELALRGQFAQVAEPLVRIRRHVESYTNIKDRNYGVEGIREAKWFDPETRQSVFFPHWRRLREFFVLILRSRSTLTGRAIMVGSLLYPVAIRWRKILIKELLFAFGLRVVYLWMRRAKGMLVSR